VFGIAEGEVSFGLIEDAGFIVVFSGFESECLFPLFGLLSNETFAVVCV
jgi:hypothetical protein